MQRHLDAFDVPPSAAGDKPEVPQHPHVGWARVHATDARRRSPTPTPVNGCWRTWLSKPSTPPPGHAQGAVPTPAQVQDIVNFETSLRTAQAIDYFAGFLNDGGASGGPVALASQQFFIGINDSFPASFGFNPTGAPFNPNIFNLFDAWTNSLGRRASIARGQALFNSKPITISGVAGINDVAGLPASFSGTCGTCHDSPNVGDHSVSAPLNIGVADLTSPLDVSYLPVFTLKNNDHRRNRTDDRSGTRADYREVGGHRKSEGSHSSRTCQPRALFSQWFGREAWRMSSTFYDKRFNIGFTAQEKADLIAFLNAL